MQLDQIVTRIEAALARANSALAPFTPGAIAAVKKEGGDPLTEADLAVDRVLRTTLPLGDEGWLSEETLDDPKRLGQSCVWIVDPIDGTKEFVAGIPEWCISVAFVVDGVPLAGGILNPATNQQIVGAVGHGVTLNGVPVVANNRASLEGAQVLASRSEVRRGQWRRFEGGPMVIKACGSVAYKFGLVAAGLTDATWTLVPKNEWDVAAGAALLRAMGYSLWETTTMDAPRFNRADTLYSGLVACAPGLEAPIRALLGHPKPAAGQVAG